MQCKTHIVYHYVVQQRNKVASVTSKLFYPVQGELGSDPCAHVFLVKLSDTESNFKYKDGFFADGG